MHLISALLIPIASAAEVVWLSPPDDTLRLRVAEAAGATGPALTPLDLRAAATEWSAADDEAIRRLDAALKDARAFEAKLDGELVILRDLAGPIAAITTLRDSTDRDRLFGALAYQGFAANRFFDTSLATDAAAEPWRETVNGLALERPWTDAVALHPEREVTAYEIAEAPQRVAFSKVRDEVRRALPASVTPVNFPAGANLVVDGTTVEVGASGNAKLIPGRHLLAAVVDGHILARWDLRFEAGSNVEASIPLTDTIWETFVAGLADGASLPESLAPQVAAMGGEVWIARPNGDETPIYRITATGVGLVELPKAGRSAVAEDDGPSGLSVAIAAGAGWLYSADFYTQNPGVAPHAKATVNTTTPSGTLSVDVDVSVLRFGVGGWVGYTPGDNHVALSGTRVLRIRPYLHGRAGLRWVQISGGYLLPYHPAAGVHGQLPVAGPVELRVDGIFGFPGVAERDQETPYERGWLTVANLGAGVRF